MEKENVKKWVVAAGKRAIKTVAQAAIATIGTAITMGQVDWRYVLSASALAGILSLFTSLAGLPELKAEKRLIQKKESEEKTNENN